MALETLVTEVQQSLERLREKRGPFSLAMLHSSSDEGDGSWTLIVSTPWADGMDARDAIRLVADELRANLSSESIPSIARITVLRTIDSFVSGITSVFSVASPGSTVHVSNSSFGGVHIPQGIIFYCQRLVPATAG